MKRFTLLATITATVLASACSDLPTEQKPAAPAPQAIAAAKVAIATSLDFSDQVADLTTRMLPSFEEKSAAALRSHLVEMLNYAAAGDRPDALLALSAARAALEPDAASPVDLGAVGATLDVIERDLRTVK